MATPTFGAIGSEKFPIDSFVVKGARDATTEIQTLDDGGHVIGKYYWYNAAGGYPAGWFDINGLIPAGIELEPGDAVFFHAQDSGVTATIPAAIPVAE